MFEKKIFTIKPSCTIFLFSMLIVASLCLPIELSQTQENSFDQYRILFIVDEEWGGYVTTIIKEFEEFGSGYEAAGVTYFEDTSPIIDSDIFTSTNCYRVVIPTCNVLRKYIIDRKPALFEFATYLGGTSEERGISTNSPYLEDLVIDSVGNIYVFGRSNSDDITTTCDFNSIDDERNAFLTKLNSKGNIVFSTSLEGNEPDQGVDIRWHSNSSYIAFSFTCSEDTPIYHEIQGEYLNDFNMLVMYVDTFSLEVENEILIWEMVVIAGEIGVSIMGVTVVIILIRLKLEEVM